MRKPRTRKPDAPHERGKVLFEALLIFRVLSLFGERRKLCKRGQRIIPPETHHPTRFVRQVWVH